MKERLKTDFSFKLKRLVSRSIRNALKKRNVSKGGKPFLKFVNYSMLKLKEHLEKQFESWMSWTNHGIYRKSDWNEEDKSTWTWQIDHIIPQCKLPYTSMEDENFKKCWALENLRPLEAIENMKKSNKLVK